MELSKYNSILYEKNSNIITFYKHLLNTKAWNVANAQHLYTFKPFDESELNGLIMVDKKHLLITVGASNRVVTYSNISFNVM